MRYKPFTGFLRYFRSTVLLQYILQYSLITSVSLSLGPTLRQPLDSQYRLISALYRLFPVVLPPVQYYPSFPEPYLVPVIHKTPVPDVRDFVLLIVQYISIWMLILTSRLPPDSRWSPATL